MESHACQRGEKVFSVTSLDNKILYYQDEVDSRSKELKSDKTVKRLYTKPTHDTTFLHFQPF